MSIDQRIREGLLSTNTQLPEPDTIQALDVVTSRGRTIARRGPIAGGLAAAAAAAAVVIAVSVSGDNHGAEPPPADQTPSQTPDTGPEVAPVWGFAYLSDPVTFEDMAENLRDHGLGDWVEPLHEKWGDVEGRIRLDFETGQLTASIPDTPVSHTNNYMVFRHFLSFEGSDSQFEATATQNDSGGQRLTLTLTKSTTQPVDGIPGEVYERALYTTVSFTEVLPPAQAEISSGTYESDPVRFGRIASTLREVNLGSWVEALREKWGSTDEPVQVKLDLNGDTLTAWIPDTHLTLTGRYTTDGSLIRIENNDPQGGDGWIELYIRPYLPAEGTLVLHFWDAGPITWDGVPAEVVARMLFPSDTPFRSLPTDATQSGE